MRTIKKTFNLRKNMDYEKKYKEAVKAVESLLSDAQIRHSNSVSANDLADVFHELAESEDDKIRKALLIHLKNELKLHGNLGLDYGIITTDAVAWLEKQGNANKEYWRGYREGKQEILDKYAELEKQSEQKSAEWSEEDTEMFGSISSTLSMYMHNTDIPSDIREIHKKEYAWFNELYNRVFPQPKQEWSEEDKMQLDAAIHLVSSTGHIETANWLKSLKDRVQPQLQQGWSKEDERIKNNCISFLGFNKEYSRQAECIDECINWLKSLRPQSHWKPSNEHMEALKSSTYCQNEQMSKVLFELYQDLKKLREG